MLTTRTKNRVQLCVRTRQTNHFHGLWLPPRSYDEHDEQDQIQEEAGLRINGSGCNQDTGDSSFTKTRLFGRYNPSNVDSNLQICRLCQKLPSCVAACTVLIVVCRLSTRPHPSSSHDKVSVSLFKLMTLLM